MTPTSPPPPNGPMHNPAVAHEHSDVNVRTILMYGVGLLVVVVLVQILMWAVFAVFERQAAANDAQTSPLAAPAAAMPPTTTASPYFGTAAEPQLLTNEPAVLQKQRATELEQLHGYGWVDQAAGVARIPIAEAKKLLVQRGLPAREDPAVDPQLGTHAPAAGEASSGRTVPTGR